MNLNQLLREELNRHVLCRDLAELKQLLAVVRPKIAEAGQSFAGDLADLAGQRLVLYGAGPYGRQMAGVLKKRGLNILCFCDDDPNLQGRSYEGLEVVGPDRLKDMGEISIYLTVGTPVTMLRITERLSALGLRPVEEKGLYRMYDLTTHGILWDTMEGFENHWGEIEEVVSWLGDEKSRYVYVNSLKARMLPFEGAHPWAMLAEGAQYWAPPEFKKLPDGVFLDIGAFIGDSLEYFIINNLDCGFRKVYSIEPMPENFEILKENARLLEQKYRLPPGRIQCLNLALGCGRPVPDEPSWPPRHFATVFDDLIRQEFPEARLFQTGHRLDDRHQPNDSALASDYMEIQELDEYFKDERIDLIKMDVEGFEMDILRGGAELIRRQKPKLAVCIYHKNSDMFVIPRYLKSLVQDYRMLVRHHHFSRYVDTVLYCY